MKQIIFILILGLLLVSCKTKRIYSETVRIDTLIVLKTITTTLPTASYIQIDKPCDSLGNLRPFTIISNVGKGKIRVEGKDNVITAQIDLDSIKQSAIEKYKSTNVSEKEIIEKRYIPSWTKWSLLANFLIVVYIGIKIKGFFV